MVTGQALQMYHGSIVEFKGIVPGTASEYTAHRSIDPFGLSNRDIQSGLVSSERGHDSALARVGPLSECRRQRRSKL